MHKLGTVIFLLFLAFSCASSSDDNPSEEVEVLPPLQGLFQDGAHPTSGTASVNSARTVLSFTDFMTDRGPILEVYLCKSDGNCDEFITLGVLKNTSGFQQYTLPDNVNLTTYDYVHIWCVEFAVSFGHAKLE